MEEKKKSKFVNTLASWIETSVVVPMSYPLDTLKSRLQTGYYKNYSQAKNHLKKVPKKDLKN